MTQLFGTRRTTQHLQLNLLVGPIVYLLRVRLVQQRKCEADALVEVGDSPLVVFPWLYLLPRKPRECLAHSGRGILHLEGEGSHVLDESGVRILDIGIQAPLFGMLLRSVDDMVKCLEALGKGWNDDL